MGLIETKTLGGLRPPHFTLPTRKPWPGSADLFGGLPRRGTRQEIWSCDL